jgi:hypothetical protein
MSQEDPRHLARLEADEVGMVEDTIAPEDVYGRDDTIWIDRTDFQGFHACGCQGRCGPRDAEQVRAR